MLYPGECMHITIDFAGDRSLYAVTLPRYTYVTPAAMELLVRAKELGSTYISIRQSGRYNNTTSCPGGGCRSRSVYFKGLTNLPSLCICQCGWDDMLMMPAWDG